MLPTPGMKATATGGALCSECGGSFPSQVALAQHLLDHNRLRALDGGVPIAVAVPTPSPVEHPTAIPPVPPVEGPRPPPVSTPPPLQNGLVKYYNAEDDFGFITRGDGSEDVFFHLQACDVQTPAISLGEIVQFEDAVGPRGWRAIRVVRKNPGVFNQERPGESPRTPTRKPSPRDEAGILRAKQKALAKLPQVYQGGRYPRFVYVDLDNIWTSFMKAKHILDYFPGAESTRDLLFNLGGLTRRLATGGPNSSVVQLVAFYFKTSESIANALRKFSHGGVSWDVRKQETTSDTSMQLELFNEVRNCEAYPKTLVLVTGDGNITPDGKSFRNIVDRYLQHGWFVEVHAWLSTTAQSYIEFQRQYPSQVVIRPFDDELVEELVQARDHVAKKVVAANNDEVDDNTETKPPKSNSTNAGKEQDQGDPQFSSHTSALVNAPASSENEIKLPQQPSQSERVIALARAMSEIVSDSDTPTGIQEEPMQSEVSERFLRERLFETVVRLLDVANDSATYIPSALAVLGTTRPYEALHLQEAESTSQCVLLRSSLQRELNRMRAGSGSSK